MASIDAIEGIGVKNATTLRKLRIRTTEALLKAGATRKGRKELAAASGFSEHQILEWVNRADLFRVKGVGEEYSDLLEAAGVDTVKELRTRNAASQRPPDRGSKSRCSRTCRQYSRAYRPYSRACRPLRVDWLRAGSPAR